MINIDEFKNKRVLITTVKQSKYEGYVDGINLKKGKFHLSGLIILQKDGNFKTVSGCSDLNKRWFNISSIIKVEVKE